MWTPTCWASLPCSGQCTACQGTCTAHRVAAMAHGSWFWLWRNCRYGCTVRGRAPEGRIERHKFCQSRQSVRTGITPNSQHVNRCGVEVQGHEQTDDTVDDTHGNRLWRRCKCDGSGLNIERHFVNRLPSHYTRKIQKPRLQLKMFNSKSGRSLKPARSCCGHSRRILLPKSVVHDAEVISVFYCASACACVCVSTLRPLRCGQVQAVRSRSHAKRRRNFCFLFIKKIFLSTKQDLAHSSELE